MAKKNTVKKSAKKPTKGKPAKKPNSKTGSGRSSVRAPPNPPDIDKKTFQRNKPKIIRIFGSRLQRGQPDFETTTPGNVTWTWSVLNNTQAAVMVVRVTASWPSRSKRDETGDLTITVLSDGEEGDVTFDDIVFEEP